MRRRLLASTALIALAAVVVLGVPLGIVEAHRVRADAVSQLEREADGVATSIDDALERKAPLNARKLRRLVRSGHEVTITAPGRPTVTVGAPITGPVISQRSGFKERARVRASVARSVVDAQVRRRWLLIGLLSLGGVLAAVALGLVQARRLARPLEQLAATSRRLGAGDFSARAGHFAIPEIDAAAAALDASALDIAHRIAAEREFTANVSHQLRTPLTALRLRLEELRSVGDTEEARIEAAAALGEADRLERTIADLLAAARRELAERDGGPLDLEELVEAHAATWRPLYARAGRRLELEYDAAPAAAASAGAVGQALDVLLDNALRHGGGRVLVRVAERDGRPTVTVTDDGPGVAAEQRALIFQRGHSGRNGSGLGLHLARSLVDSAGGKLELRELRPPEFEIRLQAAMP